MRCQANRRLAIGTRSSQSEPNGFKERVPMMHTYRCEPPREKEKGISSRIVVLANAPMSMLSSVLSAIMTVLFNSESGSSYFRAETGP